jgi:septal ring factor EnvC (AmiA/AmiB activator)
MTVEMSFLISVVSVSASIIFAYANYKKSANTDIKKEAAETATINVKLDSISKGVDDIKLEQKSTNRDVKDLCERMIAVEQSTKSAHKRIDDIIEKKEEYQKY